MPDSSSHIKKAKHNEDFVGSFNLNRTLYRDWVVVGIFYAALHYIESYLALFNKHSRTHDITDEFIKKDHRLSAIYNNYRDLKQYRWKASYRMYDFSPREVKNDILPLLDSIKNYLQKLIPPAI